MLARLEIALDSTVMASPDQVACDLEEEIVILNMRDGAYYGLNAVAALVWQVVQEPRTVREIRDLLVQEYEVETEQCTTDLFNLLEQLNEWKLIELENGKRQP